jgi:hypothetical protein
MAHWTPLTGLAGGLLIGVSASLLLWLDGKIAGCSGILGRALTADGNDRAWRWQFLLGLIVGASIWYAVGGKPPVDRPNFPAWLLVASGLLVGFGTSLGSGCTSGHGVCGLGLAISGMVYPSKVLDFLDLAGDWDGTLLFVLGARLASHW